MKILYEDNHLLVVYKDIGILSQADNTNKPDILNMAKDYIKEKYNKPGNVYLGLVHRLDINTEGIMVFSKTSKAASRLSKQIQDKVFKKYYLAVVEGKVEKGSLTDYLSKDENKRIAYIDNAGKLAKLNYIKLKEVEIDNNILSIVEIELETGRFHQIRCQFANFGHPLYGDKKYGSKNKSIYPVLQAYKIIFYHPITKEEIIIEEIDNNNYFKGVEKYL